jgi:hypothetical protein
LCVEEKDLKALLADEIKKENKREMEWERRFSETYFLNEKEGTKESMNMPEAEFVMDRPSVINNKETVVEKLEGGGLSNQMADMKRIEFVEHFAKWRVTIERGIEGVKEKIRREKKRLFHNMNLVNEKVWQIVRYGLRRNGFFIDEEDDDDDCGNEKYDMMVDKLMDGNKSVTLNLQQRFQKFLMLFKKYLEGRQSVNRAVKNEVNKLATGDEWYTHEEEDQSDGEGYGHIYDEKNIGWTWENCCKRGGDSQKEISTQQLLFDVEKLSHSRVVWRVFHILDRAGIFSNNVIQTCGSQSDLRVRKNMRFIFGIFLIVLTVWIVLKYSNFLYIIYII